MKLLALKEVEVIKPPFQNTVEEIVEWVRPTTVSVKGSTGICGGMLIHGRLFVTSHIIDDKTVRVQFSDDHDVHAIASDYENDCFLSYYAVDEKDTIPDWNELPNRTDPLEKDTYLFSFVHIDGKDMVIRFQAILPADSEMFQAQQSEDGEKLGIYLERKYTYPVVDRYGYFVGLNIGVAEGEIACQIFTPKAKL